MKVINRSVSSCLLFVTLFLPIEVIGNLLMRGPRSKQNFASINPSVSFSVLPEEEGVVFDADEWSPTASFRQDESKADGKEVRQVVNGSIPTGYMEIGTPPKQLYTIFDTGSDKLVAKTWSSITKLIQSVDAGVSKLVRPADEIYCHDASSSYEGVMEEIVDKNDVTSERKVKVHATGAIVYGSGAATTLIGRDTVNVAGISLPRFGLAEIQADKLNVLHQKDGTSAILGLQHMRDNSRGSSLFTRLRDEGHMHSFGYCRDIGNNGTFIWNDHSTEGYRVPVIGDIHWAVKMNSLKHERSTSNLFDPGSDEAPVMSILEQGSSQNVVTRTMGQTITPKRADESKVQGRPKIPAKWIERINKLRSIQHRQGKVNPPSRSRQGTLSDSWYDGEEEVADDLRDQLRHNRPSSAPSTDRRQKKMPQSDPVSKSDGHQKRHGSDSDSDSKSSSGSADSYDDSSSSSSEDDIWRSLFGGSKEKEVQPNDLCSNYPCAAVIDTGSNIIAGPKHAIAALTKRVNIRHDCGNLDTAPHLKIKLGNVLLTIPPRAYVMRVEMPAGGFDFASATDSDSGHDSEDRQAGAEFFQKGAVDRLEELGGLSIGLAEPGFYHDLNDAPPPERLSKAELWRKVFDDLHREKGIDFRHHFVGVSDAALSFQTVCVPAFSNLDANTQHGKLWILGTPVFEKYYTRWEWPKEDETPQISFLAKSISKTCMGSDVQTFQTGDESIIKATTHEGLDAEKKEPTKHERYDHTMKKASKGDARQEVENNKGREEDKKSENLQQLSTYAGRRTAASLLQAGGTEQPTFYRNVNIDDIRYPHWARDLTQI